MPAVRRARRSCHSPIVLATKSCRPCRSFVRRRISPLTEGPWRRVGQGTLGLAAVCCAMVTYGWLTLPDVRPLRTVTPTTTAFMRMRSAENVAAGKSPAISQRFVRYGRINASLVRAVLVTEDAGFYDHDGIDFD